MTPRILAALIAVAVAAPAARAEHEVHVTNTPQQAIPVNVENNASVTVTNTPTVKLSGTPSVNIANSPTVTIANSPTVQVAPGTSVQIGNNNSAPVPTVNIDSPARNAFQFSTTLIFGATTAVAVSIPAGMRLVVDFITASGDADGSGGPIQPVVILAAFLGSGAENDFYFTANHSSTVTDVFGLSQPATIYADALYIEVGYEGYTPVTLALNVAISGHLVSLTP